MGTFWRPQINDRMWVREINGELHQEDARSELLVVIGTGRLDWYWTTLVPSKKVIA